MNDTNEKNGRNETRVSELRKSAGWTQERLSEHSGVPVRTIQRLEAGHETSLETLSRIADAFKVEVRDLFATTDDAGFAAAIDGLDDRRARVRRRRAVRTTVGSVLIALGAIVGVWGVVGRSEHMLAYGIGALVVVTAGLWLLPGRPRWLPIASGWITAAVSLVYLFTLKLSTWVFAGSAAVVIAIGALLTWWLVVEQRRSA